MSRSGYSDDYDEQFPNALALYRSTVDNAIRGKRGQKFIRDLIAALDALPQKVLIANELIDRDDGAVCAIGAVGLARGIDMAGIDSENDFRVSKAFGIAPCMAREIAFENDERGAYRYSEDETPEHRWQRMRDWAVSNLKATP